MGTSTATLLPDNISFSFRLIVIMPSTVLHAEDKLAFFSTSLWEVGQLALASSTRLWVHSPANVHNAIIISPNRHLLRASPDDRLDDLDDIWAWTSTELAAILRFQSRIASDMDRGLEIDLDRIFWYNARAQAGTVPSK